MRGTAECTAADGHGRGVQEGAAVTSLCGTVLGDHSSEVPWAAQSISQAPTVIPGSGLQPDFCFLPSLNFAFSSALAFFFPPPFSQLKNDKIVSSSQTTCKPRNKLFLVSEFKLLICKLPPSSLQVIRKPEVGEGCDRGFGHRHHMGPSLPGSGKPRAIRSSSPGPQAPALNIPSWQPFSGRSWSSAVATGMPRCCQASTHSLRDPRGEKAGSAPGLALALQSPHSIAPHPPWG